MTPQARPFRQGELWCGLWALRSSFLLAGLCSLLANLLMLTPTLYMLQVYDRVMVSGSELTLLAVSLITLVLFGILALVEWVRSVVLVRAGVRLDASLSHRVFQASFQAQRQEADHSSGQALNDLVEVRQFVTGNGLFALLDLPWTPVYLAVLFFLHPGLGALGVLFVGVQLALGWFGHRNTLPKNEAAAMALQGASALLASKLRNAEVLEVMGMVPHLRRQWLARHERYLALNGAAQALSQRVGAWSKGIRYGQQALSLGMGALLAIDGQLSVGGMIAANVLMSRALAPIDLTIATWRNLSTVKAAFMRLEALLGRYPLRKPAQSTRPRGGALSLRGVVAGVPGRAQPVLDNIDLLFPQGSVTVVLGPSGSGKSSLAKAMLGLWPQLSGEVCLDGLPLSGWARSFIGPCLGYLPQEVELLEGSIAENIARLSAVDPAKVIAAAKRCGLHDMILRLPQGYDTPVGEAGGLLSAGQRQRIALARALYGDPLLVVLDEPNANLDEAGEAALVQAIADMRSAGTTVVLITHRFAAMGVADRVVVLDQGRVHAQGPREAFFKQFRPVGNGKFASISGVAAGPAAGADAGAASGSSQQGMNA